MRYFSITGFTDREGRIWFNAEKWVSTAQFDATFPELTLEMLQPEPPPVITAELREFTCTAEASYTLVLTGDIEADLTPMEMVGQGFVNLLAAAVEPLSAAWHSGASIAANFLEPECRMGQGYLVAGDLSAFVCQAFSEYRSKNMDNCQFKELTMEALGSNAYTFMEASLPELEMEATIGTGLECELEALQAACTGQTGLVGGMDCRLLRMTADLTIPVPNTFIAESPPLELQMEGDQPIRATLALTVPSVEGTLHGITGNYAQLETRFSLLALSGGATAHPVASLVAEAPYFQFSAGVITEVGGINLDAEFDRLSLLASLITDGPNGIEVIFPPIGGGLVEDRETCALAATLSYEVTL